MRALRSSDKSIRSAGPRPFITSRHSTTSFALPTARPSGQFCAVITAWVFTPAALPMPTSMRASVRASRSVFMNAPSPDFTSSTSAFTPSAIFLLMMEAAISGMHSIVPVTSRSAYSFLSAGAISAVCPTSAHPMEASDAFISATDKLVRKPGIDSSLSSVPPVCPSPRPDIIGTTAPEAATTGAITSEVLSPTPPVLCLSTFDPGMPERSSRTPDPIMASVSAEVSSAVMPRKNTAIRSADAW